nr:MAG TPA: hypothetical protein [Caudoviricetes sp.]
MVSIILILGMSKSIKSERGRFGIERTPILGKI